MKTKKYCSVYEICLFFRQFYRANNCENVRERVQKKEKKKEQAEI